MSSNVDNKHGDTAVTLTKECDTSLISHLPSEDENSEGYGDHTSPSVEEDNSYVGSTVPCPPTTEPENGTEEPLTTHWYRLTTAQRNRCRQRITSWLGENYMVSTGVRLLVEVVYQHYCLFCGKYTRGMPVSKAVFERILTKNFPTVTLKEEQIGRRPRKYFYYFEHLDIQESSEEFETVCKGRKLVTTQRKRSGRKAGDKISHSKYLKTDLATQATEPTGDKDEDASVVPPSGVETANHANETECATVSCVKWRDLAASEKELHKEATEKWLQTEYEADSNVCMPRTAVFSHYLQHCRNIATVPAPQAIFGRIIQKTYPRILMRRLGIRGESKYYYMGLDIRPTSDRHADLSADKVLSMGIKPKSNRLYINAKT